MAKSGSSPVRIKDLEIVGKCRYVSYRTDEGKQTNDLLLRGRIRSDRGGVLGNIWEMHSRETANDPHQLLQLSELLTSNRHRYPVASCGSAHYVQRQSLWGIHGAKLKRHIYIPSLAVK